MISIARVRKLMSAFKKELKTLSAHITNDDIIKANRDMMFRLEYCKSKEPPPTLIASLASVTSTHHERHFYKTYANVLNMFFDHSLGYTVSPQQSLPPLRRDKGEHTADFMVLLRNKTPVLFVEAKPPANLAYHSTRCAADSQMRDCLARLGKHAAMPKLYGISIMGSNFALYSRDYANGGVTTPVNVAGNVPRSRWAADLAQTEGWATFVNIVKEVKVMAESLED